MEDTYAVLSLQVREAKSALPHKKEERKRIDEIIKAWKDADIDILAKRDDKGITAIHEATLEGDIDKIKALKELGADVSQKTDGGVAPMHIAAWNGQVDAIKVLKERCRLVPKGGWWVCTNALCSKKWTCGRHQGVE